MTTITFAAYDVTVPSGSTSMPASNVQVGAVQTGLYAATGRRFGGDAGFTRRGRQSAAPAAVA